MAAKSLGFLFLPIRVDNQKRQKRDNRGTVTIPLTRITLPPNPGLLSLRKAISETDSKSAVGEINTNSSIDHFIITP